VKGTKQIENEKPDTNSATNENRSFHGKGYGAMVGG
jgi:hypothetical protein